MPIVIPPFVQYQAPVIPLRGLWNNPPLEGDRFATFEVAWGITTGEFNAVQIAVAGNSPVAMSQIVALNVDNSRSGADIQFLFPDSGAVLVVPAYNQGLFPIFTNALTFYVSAPTAVPGDLSVFQVLNSIPPPVAVNPSVIQDVASESGIPLLTTGNTYSTIIPAPINGLITGFNISWQSSDAGASSNLVLQDGQGRIIWAGAITGPWGNITVSPINVRFALGVVLGILGSDYSNGTIFCTIYYTTP